MPERELDIVLFGATGFVGALTAAHLAEHARRTPASPWPAARARSSRRCGPSSAAAALDWELVAVDATDAAGLRALAARTHGARHARSAPTRHTARRSCGPAPRQGTHYADLTGEVLFVRWSLDEVDARARETGAAIVHACGFDSIPSDLGVLVTAQRAAADGAGSSARRPCSCGR